MDNRYNYDDPWNCGIYETGRTRPRKRRWGCLAFLLVLITLLVGIISLLSLHNGKLFHWLSSDTTLLSWETMTSEVATCDSSIHGNQETLCISDPVELSTSPYSVPNIPQEGGLSLQEIYNRNIASVVSILCDNGTGSGVVLSADGYVVTNCHVVEGAAVISVLLWDEREFPATLVGADAVSDLAVLRIEADGLVPAEFGDSGVLDVGDSVAAIGDPLGVEFRGTMTNGIVSAINRNVATGGRTMTLIQTNAALNSGNSGGPLINCYGQVVGINTMKIGVFSDSSGVEGIGFAIPSITVLDVVNQLITQGYVSGRPTLGLSGQTLSTFDQYYFRIPAGLYIESVQAGSPAEQAGIRPGDVLVQVDEIRIVDAAGLDQALYDAQVGQVVTVILYRSNYYYEVNLELMEAKG